MIQRFEPNARRSRMVVHGDTVYLAGQVADDRDADMATQTAQALRKIDELLRQAGSDKSHLLSAMIWIRTLDDFAAMNQVWDAWTAPGAAPTRSCCVAQLVDPRLRVEITVVAATMQQAKRSSSALGAPADSL